MLNIIIFFNKSYSFITKKILKCLFNAQIIFIGKFIYTCNSKTYFSFLFTSLFRTYKINPLYSIVSSAIAPSTISNSCTFPIKIFCISGFSDFRKFYDLTTPMIWLYFTMLHFAPSILCSSCIIIHHLLLS